MGKLSSQDPQPERAEEAEGFPDAGDEAAEQSCENEASSDEQGNRL